MTPKRHKRPSQSYTPKPSKIPKAQEMADFWGDYPAWRIQHLEMIDPYGWHKLNRDMLEYIRHKLTEFEKRTLDEILNKSKKQNHQIKVSEICKEARNRLQKLKLDDIDELVSLRFAGKERVWGILERHTISLLWWDPNHAVCPSSKKHT